MKNCCKHYRLLAQTSERISVAGAIDNRVAHNERQHNDRNDGDRSNETNAPRQASTRLNTRDDQDHKTDATEEQAAQQRKWDEPHVLHNVQTLSTVDVGVSDVIGHVVGYAWQIGLVNRP